MPDDLSQFYFEVIRELGGEGERHTRVAKALSFAIKQINKTPPDNPAPQERLSKLLGELPPDTELSDGLRLTGDAKMDEAVDLIAAYGFPQNH